MILLVVHETEVLTLKFLLVTVHLTFLPGIKYGQVTQFTLVHFFAPGTTLADLMGLLGIFALINLSLKDWGLL